MGGVEIEDDLDGGLICRRGVSIDLVEGWLRKELISGNDDVE